MVLAPGTGVGPVGAGVVGAEVWAPTGAADATRVRTRARRRQKRTCIMPDLPVVGVRVPPPGGEAFFEHGITVWR
jgi:hypothetical protein